MKSKWTYMIGLLLTFGCEEATDWQLDAVQNNLLVVEAQVTNEFKRHTVKLSRTFADLNGQPEPVSGALVAVGVDDNVTLFSEFPANSGMYYSDSIQAVVGKTYQLYIKLDEQEYYAIAQMEPVTPLKPLSYQLVDQENRMYEINFQDSDSPSKKEYWISWGHLPSFQGQTLTETLAKTYHYTLESIDVNQLFKPDKDKIRFPAGSVVLRRKYSISSAQQEFYRTFLSETQWRGSPFDIQKGNVVTNLSEGAVGFFAVSSVVADTTLIQP